MNRIITRSIYSLVLLTATFFLVPLMAQNEEQVEKFKQERESYYTEKLALTDQEAKVFWPVYNDFRNRKMKLFEDERNTFKYSHKNRENLSDEEIKEALEKIRILKDQQHQLEQEYYHKEFPKVLPPKKVLMLYKVEWDFRNHLIRKLRGNGDKHKGSSGGSGGGSQGASEHLPDMRPCDEPVSIPVSFDQPGI